MPPPPDGKHSGRPPSRFIASPVLIRWFIPWEHGEKKSPVTLAGFTPILIEQSDDRPPGGPHGQGEKAGGFI